MKKIYFIALIASLSLAMTSCSDWDSPYYVDDIVGTWVSEYGSDGYGDYSIMGFDVVRYDFYYDFTGRYTYYSAYGLSYVDFDWETHGDRLYIRYYDGDYENLYYGFNNYGYLILSLDRHFYRYTAYRPGGGYYDQEKPLPDLNKTDAAEETKTVKSVSRAIKARVEAED